MARPRFQRYTAAEKSRVLAKYRRLIAAGKSPTAAARAAGTDLNVIEKWSDAESTPVAVVRDRPCLGGCGEIFRSAHSGNRICPKCRGQLAALPAAWSASRGAAPCFKN